MAPDGTVGRLRPDSCLVLRDFAALHVEWYLSEFTPENRSSQKGRMVFQLSISGSIAVIICDTSHVR